VRVHRLKVVNFRGVVERDVEFADTGVTVIEGENEAGKSSMVEALDLLLTTRDKSSKASVRAVQPSGRDVGSEVTAEISCGPWRFEYFKRFNKAPETSLTILEPKPEQLTGRAAHERVEQILDASLDRTLYRALSLLQSTDPELGALTDSSALSRALDRAAGDVDVDQAGESLQTQDLLAAVTAEYQRYFTAAQGRPTGELLAAERAAAEASSAVAERERILATVQEATDRLPGVAAAIAEYAELESEQRVEVARLAAEVAQADAVVEKLDKSKAVVAQRQAEAAAAAKAVTERKDLRARLGQAESDVASGRAAVESSRNDARVAAERAEELGIEATAAQERLAALRERIVTAEAAEVVARDRRRRAELDATLAEAARLQAELSGAVKVAAHYVATDADASRAVDLDRAIAAAQARVDAGAPTVIVTPLGGGVTVDGEAVTDEITVKAGRALSVDATDVRVRVVPGTDAQASADELEALRDEATALVDRCGVERLSDVVPAAARRTEALGRIREVERALRRELGEHSVDDLTSERAAVDARIPDVEPGEVDDLGALRVRERDAANACSAAERARDVESARVREHSSRAEVWETSGQRAAQTVVALREEIVRAVADASDADLVSASSAAATDLENARVVASRIALDATRMDVPGVRARFNEAEAALDRTRTKIADERKTQTELTTRLEVCRSDGRFDELSDAVAENDAAAASLRRVTDRAAGARVLFETLQRKRTETRARYVDPFTRRLEELAGPVFGEGVRFGVADDFQIQTRTLDGVTVDVESLSGGAREQLGLLARLACASLIDQADGVPVILDDALGYSDPKRLSSMAQVLGHAAGDSQIIVLTCTPDRYRDVRDATLIAV
jgi:chromosome segregation ATPase